MNYFQIINDTLDYIETQIRQPVSLEHLAGRAHMSRYHFLRIFKALTNKTPKEYIDARKLTEASKRLVKRRGNIVDIALEFGFESHEVFTRRFKQFYGITPSDVKRGHMAVPGQERLEVVERDFTNNRNRLFPSYNIVQIPDQNLAGRTISFEPDDPAQLRKVSNFVAAFVEESSQGQAIHRLFGVVLGSLAPGRVQYFTGIESDQSEPEQEALILPFGDYAAFSYGGSLDRIYDTVFADVCTALLLSGRELNKQGIELFEVYNNDYFRTGKFSIFIPVK